MHSKLPLDPDMHKYQSQRLADKNPFEAVVIRVCDGDTLLVAQQLEPGVYHCQEFVRLAGIDAPEMRAIDARPAMWAQMYLSNLVLHQVVTVLPRRIWRDPYHRIIASVTFNGLDLAACLIDSGNAVPYPKKRHGQSRYKPDAPSV